MPTKLGMNAKLYFSDTLLSPTNSAADATWTEIGNTTDVTLNLETGTADVTTRGNNGWRATRATLKDGSIELAMNWDPADPAFTAIQTAWSNAEEIAMAAMDGGVAIEGSQGLVSNFSVTNFSRAEALEDAIKVSVTLKPSSRTAWYTAPAAA